MHLVKKYFVAWIPARKPLINAIILWRDHIYIIAEQFGAIAPDLHHTMCTHPGQRAENLLHVL